MYHKILYIYIYTQCISASILPTYNGQMIFSDVPLIKITQCVSWSPGVEIVQRLGSPKSLRSFWDPEKKTGIINITNSNKSTIFRGNHGKYVWRFVSSLILPKKKLGSLNPHGIQNGPKKNKSEKRPTIQQHQTNGPLDPPPDAPMPWQIPRDIVFAPGPAANDSDYLVIQPGMCLMYVSKNQVTHTKVMMFNWYILSRKPIM